MPSAAWPGEQSKVNERRVAPIVWGAIELTRLTQAITSCNGEGACTQGHEVLGILRYAVSLSSGGVIADLFRRDNIPGEHIR